MAEPRDESLAEYRRKRDFTKTREPAGEVAAKREDGRLRFVIQKHDATALHYDLRLEVHGVMKSWAVPRGLSVDPADKRLAMEVEDHPMEYNRFEGTIPAGEYGGGTVLLWDRGTYWPDEAGDEDHETAMVKAHAAGKISFLLRGERLRGSWALVRTDGGPRPKWLVIKHRDRYAKPGFDITEAYVTSVETDRTLEEIAEDRESETWSSAAIAPMLATPADTLPGGRGWVFERRHAGTRVHVYVTAESVRILALGRDVTRRHAALAEKLAVLAADGPSLVLDGVIDVDGVFHASDVLFHGGDILLEEPWSARRERLETILAGHQDGVAPAEVERTARAARTKAKKHGWTGIIGKREGSTYQPGTTSDDWVDTDVGD
ncbi:MAG: hypothetical protein L0271_12055 [Gemmatimonadetes bacterium]|nr:hypothetical protein [Gemmatimonadota bacterium]